MSWIICGIIFLFFDFYLDGISVTPAFVGYLLILWGMGKRPDCETFRRSRPVLWAGAVLSGLTWLGALFRMPMPLQVSVPLMVVSVALQLLTMYRLTQGMVELENLSGRAMDTGKLTQRWSTLCIGYVLTSILGLFGGGIVSIVLLAVVLVRYLMAFSFSRRALEAVETP